MSNYNIRADLSKNRLYMSISGFMDDDLVTQVVDKVIAEAKKLKPGFAVINDISTFKPATPKGAEEIKRAQLFVKENGVGRVIRVTGQDGIAAMQFSRISKTTTGYEADQVTTVEDAEKLLDQG